MKAKQKTKLASQGPKVSSRWVTTDADERALRQERACEEPMRMSPLEQARSVVFQNYEVIRTDSAEATPYRVELRALDAPANTCSCADFRKNFLGTCKHIERVLMVVKRPKRGGQPVSPRAELFMTREPYAPRLVVGDGVPEQIVRRLGRHTDASGRLRCGDAASLAALIECCDAIATDAPTAVRVSAEVRDWLTDQEARERLAQVAASYRADMLAAKGLSQSLRMPLYPYQIDGMLHLAFKGRAMLADEMGLGKTVQAIAAAAAMREVMGVKRVLVVAPASLKAEWEEQIRTFTSLPQEVLFGSRRDRLQRYQQTQAFFVIANYEQIVRDVLDVNALLKPDLIILDEAQRIKNWRTKTARYLKRLDARFAFVLTGTPLENRIDELYSITEFIAPSLFGSLFRFNRRFYRFDADGKVAGMQNLSELHEAVGTVMLRRRKDEVDEQLPDRIDNTYFVSLTPEQRTRYAEYEEIVARYYHLAKRRPLRPEEMDRLQNALACMRMCCDSCYILDPQVRDAPKLDELEKVLDDIWSSDPQRKVLIFSEWVRMLELAQERLNRLKIGYALHIGSLPQQRRRQEIIRFKEDPECRVFLSSESGGVGLNLQTASVVVNLDLPWNPAKLEQRIARAWRKHQKNRVNVINLVAQDTLEHRMLATLTFKQGLADAVLDARGEIGAFEGNNARGAFMARLAEVMDSPLQAPASDARATEAVASIPADERLAAALRTENPGVGLCLARYDEAEGQVQAVLAVGRREAEPALRAQVERTHGVVLPPNRVVVVSPETQALLRHLADLGFITIRQDAARTIFDSGVEQAPLPPEHLTRCRRAQETVDKAQRALRMSRVLAEGGFDEEAARAASQAVRQAAGALYLFADGADADDAVEPLTEAMVAAITHRGDLDRTHTGLLQAVYHELDADPRNLREHASAFVDYCAAQAEKQKTRMRA